MRGRLEAGRLARGSAMLSGAAARPPARRPTLAPRPHPCPITLGSRGGRGGHVGGARRSRLRRAGLLLASRQSLSPANVHARVSHGEWMCVQEGRKKREECWRRQQPALYHASTALAWQLTGRDAAQGQGSKGRSQCNN